MMPMEISTAPRRHVGLAAAGGLLQALFRGQCQEGRRQAPTGSRPEGRPDSRGYRAHHGTAGKTGTRAADQSPVSLTNFLNLQLYCG